MRLIDADALRTIQNINKANFNSIETIQKWIDEQPTVEEKKTGTCTECVYEDRFDYQYPCRRCIRIASCGRDGDYYKAKEEDDG